MKAERTRPEKKIYELQLLQTIREYDRTHGHMGWPPTAWNLFDLRMYFAPSLTRIDTLRQWLLRHRGRTLRILPGYRPFRYELTREGERRIAYLQNHDKSTEDFKLERIAAELERLLERKRRPVYVVKRRKREIDRTDVEVEFYLQKVITTLRRKRARYLLEK